MNKYKAIHIQGWHGKAIDVWMNRITRQSHRCWDEPEYRGKAVWRTVGHGCETPDPQQDSSPRRCQKRARGALEIASSELLNTRQYKAKIQAIQGVQGKAIDVWMNRITRGNTRHTRHTWQSHRCLDGPASTMEKPCGALWGMVG